MDVVKRGKTEKNKFETSLKILQFDSDTGVPSAFGCFNSYEQCMIMKFRGC